MTNRDQGLGRRAFLGASAAGVASAVAPRATLAQSPVAPAPAVPRTAVTALTSERLLGSAVNYAYAVKAGPFVFLNGHEGYDFAAGVVPAVAGAAGFPAYGKPGLRREADFIFERMGQNLKRSAPTSRTASASTNITPKPTRCAPITSRALPRSANTCRPAPRSSPSAASAAKSTMTTSLIAVMPDPQWELKPVYPPRRACVSRPRAMRPPWW